MHFRIYSLGILEVRTVQEIDGEELVGAVFSTQPLPKAAGPSVDVDEHEKLSKATLYVERAGGSIKAACPSAQRRYFVIFETATGRKIRMELLATGEATWEPEPADLEDRNSLAKVLVSADCKLGLLFGDIKSYQASLSKGDQEVASPRMCKRHAQKLFVRATGVSAPRPYQGASFGFMAHHPATKHNEAVDKLIARYRQMSQAKSNLMQAQFSKR